MGDVELCMDEDGHLKLLQHDNLRFLLRRLRLSDLQRHLVATWPNCGRLRQYVEDASLILRAFFLFCLSLALIRIFYELHQISTLPPYGSSGQALPYPYISDQIWEFRDYHLMRQGIVFLAVFTAIFVIRVLVKMKIPPSPQQTEVEVKTISGLVQHL